MIGGMRVLALIPARGGSKGIKKKNMISLCGKPLIFYTIQAARESKYTDSVIVSTDDEQIAGIANECGAEIPFVRPKEFAGDESKTIDTVIHAIRTLRDKQKRDYDILMLLQPTSPLRTCQDIDRALDIFVKSRCLSVASVNPVSDPPLLIRGINDAGELSPLLKADSAVRRQDMEQYYRVNGAIYINLISEIDERTNFNDNVRPYIMDIMRSVDIDDMFDLVIAQAFLESELHISV
jgi:CMP-N-acetylneuraminic acid synthetase